MQMKKYTQNSYEDKLDDCIFIAVFNTIYWLYFTLLYFSTNNIFFMQISESQQIKTKIEESEYSENENLSSYSISEYLKRPK